MIPSQEPGSSESHSANSPSPSTASISEPSILVPKAQLDLLVNQLSCLATSVVKKQKLNADDIKKALSAPLSSNSNQADTNDVASYRSTASNSSSLSRSATKARAMKLSEDWRAAAVPENNKRSKFPPSPSSLTHRYPPGFNDFPKQDIEDLMKTLPKYTGHVSESFSWWTTQIDSFLKTFNLRNYDIEYFIPKLLSGRAMDLYKSVQKNIYNENLKNAKPVSNETAAHSDTNESATDTDTQSFSVRNQPRFPKVRMRPLHWNVVKQELAKLDNPVARTAYLYSKIRNLRHEILSQLTASQTETKRTCSIPNQPSSMFQQQQQQPLQQAAQVDVSSFVMNGPTIDSLITKFKALETQLEYPAPLPDRMVLLFDVLPECKNLVLDKINHVYEENLSVPFQNIDEVCDFILIYKDDILKRANSGTTGSNASTSFSSSRKKRGQTSAGPTGTLFNDKPASDRASERAVENSLDTNMKPNSEKLGSDRIGNARFKDRQQADRSTSNSKSSPPLQAVSGSPRPRKEPQYMTAKTSVSSSLPMGTQSASFEKDELAANAAETTKANKIDTTDTSLKATEGPESINPSLDVSSLNTVNKIALEDYDAHNLNAADMSLNSSSDFDTDDGQDIGDISVTDNTNNLSIDANGDPSAIRSRGISSSVLANDINAAAGSTVCNYCGRIGHKSTKCFKKKKDRQRERLKLVNQSNADSDAASNNDTILAGVDTVDSMASSFPNADSTEQPLSAFDNLASTTNDIINSASNR